MRAVSPVALILDCMAADNLSKAGWSWGGVSSTDQNGAQFWVAAAERVDTGRFIVRTDEKLAAFLELESAIRAIS